MPMTDLGNSVAEFDQELGSYFVETDTFRALVADKTDIIAVDKGVGKMALYQYLQRRYAQIPELSKVEIITGFNSAGSPIFENLVYTGPLSEGQYTTVWKTYILSLVGLHFLAFAILMLNQAVHLITQYS